MPYEATYSNDDRCITYVGSGLVLGAALVSATRALIADVRTPSLTHCLIDLSGVTDLHVSNDEIDIIAAEGRRVAAIAPHVTVAVVATRDLAFGLARMWEALVATPGWKTRVFRDRGAACEWLSAESGNPPR